MKQLLINNRYLIHYLSVNKPINNYINLQAYFYTNVLKKYIQNILIISLKQAKM